MFGTNNNNDFFAVGKTTTENLRNDFAALLGKFSNDELLIEEICRFVIACYSEKHRAYHNLGHIGALLFQAESLSEKFRDRESVGLAIWFHDVIYQPKSSKNEIKSAELAVEKLSVLNVSKTIINKIEKMILATRNHKSDGLDEDRKLFLDLDLSILGAKPDVYENYSAAIRREYSFVPWFLYRRSRRKILESFLEREFLYFTAEMRGKYETAARANVANEIKELS